MPTFRVKNICELPNSEQFGMTGSVVDGEIRAGMFLKVWINWQLYYPFKILAVDVITDTPPGNVRLTLDSEMGEKGLISDLDLSEKTLTVAVDE